MKLRVIGGALMLLCVIAFQPGAPTLTQQLLIPLGMAVGTALIVRNLLAVLITAALLGLIQTDWANFLPLLSAALFGSSTELTAGSIDEPLAWIAGLAYPLLAAISLLLALGILGARFRRHIEATRDVRQARRSSQPGAAAGDDLVSGATTDSASSSRPNGITDADQERPHEG